MIVSHKHKFIFIKTTKTAGTSIEIALSEHCGPDDIITPLDPEDEIIRKDRGYRGPQNTRVPVSRYRLRDWWYMLKYAKKLEFFNHTPAYLARRWLGPEIWDEYTVFCVERNPYDKIISRYYWSTSEDDRPDLGSYIMDEYFRKITNWHLYTEKDVVIVDNIIQYDTLHYTLCELWDRIGIPQPPSLPRAKGGYRKDKRSYRDILSDEERQMVYTKCRKEIDLFNYKF